MNDHERVSFEDLDEEDQTEQSQRLDPEKTFLQDCLERSDGPVIIEFL